MSERKLKIVYAGAYYIAETVIYGPQPVVFYWEECFATREAAQKYIDIQKERNLV